VALRLLLMIQSAHPFMQTPNRQSNLSGQDKTAYPCMAARSLPAGQPPEAATPLPPLSPPPCAFGVLALHLPGRSHKQRVAP
jgi:hypothetical protein